MVCKICENPKIEDVEISVKSGRITIKEAAMELGADYQSTWSHFKHCLKEPVEDKDFEDLLKILQKLIFRLDRRVDELEEAPTNLVSVKMLTALASSLRGCIKDLAELEGKIRTSPLIHLTNVTMKLDKITSFLFSELCDACKEKFIIYVEELEQ